MMQFVLTSRCSTQSTITRATIKAAAGTSPTTTTQRWIHSTSTTTAARLQPSTTRHPFLAPSHPSTHAHLLTCRSLHTSLTHSSPVPPESKDEDDTPVPAAAEIDVEDVEIDEDEVAAEVAADADADVEPPVIDVGEEVNIMAEAATSEPIVESETREGRGRGRDRGSKGDRPNFAAEKEYPRDYEKPVFELRGQPRNSENAHRRLPRIYDEEYPDVEIDDDFHEIKRKPKIEGPRLRRPNEDFPGFIVSVHAVDERSGAMDRAIKEAHALATGDHDFFIREAADTTPKQKEFDGRAQLLLDREEMFQEELERKYGPAVLKRVAPEHETLSKKELELVYGDLKDYILPEDYDLDKEDFDKKYKGRIRLGLCPDEVEKKYGGKFPEESLREVKQRGLSYHQKHGENNNWEEKVPGQPEDHDPKLVEVLHMFDPLMNMTRQYVVGSEDCPPVFWPPPGKGERIGQQRFEDDEREGKEGDGDQLIGEDVCMGEDGRIKYPAGIGRLFLTWTRDWADMRKYGINPAPHEIEYYLREILGQPKPTHIPVLPNWAEKKWEKFRPVTNEELAQTRVPKQLQLDQIPAFLGHLPNIRYDRLHTEPWQVLKSESGWRQYLRQGQRPKTHFEEARKQYEEKLHLIRVKWLAEYRRVKALHDANIQARWDEGVQRRKEKAEYRAARRIMMRARQEKLYDQMAAKRKRVRQISRFNRQNKEMKWRRFCIHMFNYILKEREYHWIQPKVVEEISSTSGQKIKTIVHSPNLNVKLFERQENIVGFWPKPREQDMEERKEEEYRRKLIKELA